MKRKFGYVRFIGMLSLILVVQVNVCMAKIISDDPYSDSSWVAAIEYDSTWATEAWIDYVAHIVASEARNVPTADLPVACTLVRDVTIRNYHPWKLYGNPGRWHGYGLPDVADYRAVRTALEGGCDDIPDFRYFGCMNDMGYFVRHGYVADQPLSLYVGANGSMVVGIP